MKSLWNTLRIPGIAPLLVAYVVCVTIVIALAA